jgi:hypothetical protein
MPIPQNVHAPPMWLTSQPKFWPKKLVMTVSGRKMVATIVSRSCTSPQVVADIAVVRGEILLEPAQRRHLLHGSVKRLALDHEHAPERSKCAPEQSHLVARTCPGSLEHRGLVLLHRAHNALEHIGKRVGQRVEHSVDERLLARRRPVGQHFLHELELPAPLAVDGEHEPSGDVQVHVDRLRQAATFIGRPEVHKEQLVLVSVYFGALTELLGVLDRELVEAEQVPDLGNRLMIRIVEVKPEKLAAAEESRELREVGRSHDSHAPRLPRSDRREPAGAAGCPSRGCRCA